jgi:hypothetical protein
MENINVNEVFANKYESSGKKMEYSLKQLESNAVTVINCLKSLVKSFKFGLDETNRKELKGNNGFLESMLSCELEFDLTNLNLVYSSIVTFLKSFAEHGMINSGFEDFAKFFENQPIELSNNESSERDYLNEIGFVEGFILEGKSEVVKDEWSYCKYDTQLDQFYKSLFKLFDESGVDIKTVLQKSNKYYKIFVVLGHLLGIYRASRMPTNKKSLLISHFRKSLETSCLLFCYFSLFLLFSFREVPQVPQGLFPGEWSPTFGRPYSPPLRPGSRTRHCRQKSLRSEGKKGPTATR